MKRLTVRADEVEVGDRLTEWGGGFTVGFAEGPGERVTELFRPGDGFDRDPEVAGMVEAWTETATIVGTPDLTLAPSDPVEVWR